MENNVVLIIIVIGFQLIIMYGIVSSVIVLIKSIGYKPIKALVIDNVILGSKEWGKYFPEEYNNVINIGSKMKKISDKLDNFDRLRNIISSISIGKNSISVRKKLTIDRTKEDDNDTYTMVAEYIVDSKKYYYCESFINESKSNNPFKNMMGKEIEIKYNPNNPKKCIRKSSNIKGIILLLVMEFIFGVILFLLNK